VRIEATLDAEPTAPDGLEQQAGSVGVVDADRSGQGDTRS
jgi:hypothetical protein